MVSKQQMGWVENIRKALEDPGWQGPERCFLLFYRDTHRKEPAFLVRVVPDPEWSNQRWRLGWYVRCSDLPGELAKQYWTTREFTEAEFGTHVAFETFDVYDIDARNMESFD